MFFFSRSDLFSLWLTDKKTVPTRNVSVSLSINKSFNSSLTDPSSDLYQQYVRMIKPEVSQRRFRIIYLLFHLNSNLCKKELEMKMYLFICSLVTSGLCKEHTSLYRVRERGSYVNNSYAKVKELGGTSGSAVLCWWDRIPLTRNTL